MDQRDNLPEAASNTPHVLLHGVVRLAGVEVPCYVLTGAVRVLSQRGIAAVLGFARGGSSRGGQMPDFLHQRWLEPFIHEDLAVAAKSPIRFPNPEAAGVIHGYPARVLMLAVRAIMDADRYRATTSRQRRQVERAHAINAAVFETGIDVLVDEATGYDEVKGETYAERCALYFEHEKHQWSKTFEDRFFREIYRLKSMDPPEVFHRRPAFIGSIIKDLYARVSPGMVDELEDRNPKNENGHRSHRHHQWLSLDYGYPRFRAFLESVILLMEVCSTWEEFMCLLDQKRPRLESRTQYLLQFGRVSGSESSSTEPESTVVN